MPMRDIYYGLLIVGGLAIGLGGFMNGFLSDYGIANTNNLTSFRIANHTFTQIENISSTFTGSSITGDTIPMLDIFYSTTTGGFKAIQLILNSVNLFQALISDTINTIGIPQAGILTIIIMGMLTAFIIFEILSAVLKWRI